MAQRPRDTDLIDFSPPSSGSSTPASHSQSQASAGTYGLGSALTGLWRRISSNDPASFLPMHAATFPLMVPEGDGVHGAYTPPRRTVSPLVLPSLEPVTLTGHKDGTPAGEKILSRGIAEEIRTFLPERLKIGDRWRLVYSLYQNGSSLSTLYKLCEEYRGRRVGFVLVVRDAGEGTFGAYLTEAPHPAASYYGTGECFLWRASVHVPLPPPPSADTEHMADMRSTTIAASATDILSDAVPNGHTASAAAAEAPSGPIDLLTGKAPSGQQGPVPMPQSVRFQNFAYTGMNDYCIFCEPKFLSVGGGSGAYGLWLDDSFSRGHSAPCETFMNQSLSDQGEKFDVLGVELWVVGAG